MNRTLLPLLIILGGVLFLGGTGYWFMHQDTPRMDISVPESHERTAPAPEQRIVPTATTETGAIPETPATIETKPSIPDDENTSPPTSVSRQKFESGDDMDDTADSVTIEVEPEEE